MARICLQLTAQAKYLGVYAAIEDIFMHPGCGQQLLAAEHPLRRLKERREQTEFAVRQRDQLTTGRGQLVCPQVQHPVAKSVKSSFFVLVVQRIAFCSSVWQGREPIRWRVSYPTRIFLLFLAMPVDALIARSAASSM